MIIREKLIGTLVTFVLSVVVLLLLYGTEPFLSLRTNMFGAGGDIQKDIFNTYWQAKYDDSTTHCESMNYPYGEETIYTGCQTFVSAPIQWLRRVGVGDFSDYTLLLMNLILIASILLSPIFLYLLFYELKVAEWIAVVSAVAITFFSPQIGRVSAHLTLAYIFVLPCVLYLFLRWFSTRRISYSIWIAVLTFFAMLAHPYYVIFIGVIWIMVWLYLFLSKKIGKSQMWKSVCHSLVQMVVPVVLFMLLTQSVHNDGVRALIPTGFYKYVGSLSGVFLPGGRYGLPPFSCWEGMVWIGFLSIAVFVVGMFKVVVKSFHRQWRAILYVTDNEFLNLMFWTSVILLLFSFGIPLSWFPLRLLAYLGPLGQVRALGRFGWLFFFVLNIVSVYVVSSYIHKIRPVMKILLSVLVVFVLVADVVGMYTQYHFRYNAVNPSPIFSDIDNVLPENQWVKRIDALQYQSYLPLPYFSVGSEHLYYAVSNKDFARAFYVSAKTGLPMHSLHASRSVIAQAYDNQALVKYPYIPFPVFSDLPDQRHILLTAPTGGWIRSEEQALLEYAEPLFSSSGIDFYKMEIADFTRYEYDFQKKMSRTADSCSVYEKALGVYCNDTSARFVLLTFDDESASVSFVGESASEHYVTSLESIYDGCPNISGTIEVSFLLGDYLDNRSGYYKLCVQCFSQDGKELYCEQPNLDGCVTNVFNGWARVEYKIRNVASTDRIVVSVGNSLREKGNPVYVDNLLLREENVHVVNGDGNVRLLDNYPVK